MTAHTCTTLTDGCYRCELNKDEIRDHLYSLKVTRRGVVHEEWCSFVSGPCSTVVAWLPVPAGNDRACKHCMPEGLPDLSILTN